MERTAGKQRKSAGDVRGLGRGLGLKKMRNVSAGRFPSIITMIFIFLF